MTKIKNAFHLVGDIEYYGTHKNLMLLRFSTEKYAFKIKNASPHIDAIFEELIKEFKLTDKTKLYFNANLYFKNESTKKYSVLSQNTRFAPITVEEFKNSGFRFSSYGENYDQVVNLKAKIDYFTIFVN